MHFTSATVASCLLLAGSSMVNAQYGDSGSYPPAAAAPPAPAAAASEASSPASSAPQSQVSVHVVRVSDANAKLAFEPADIKANVGDMIQYHFYPKVCLSSSTF